jgi:23S rRNA G2069 N7-methylase RlmK/C1962 C5-methylase RlmI
MCFTSLVMDQYRPYLPVQPWTPPVVIQRPYTPEELAELIESFKEAVKAAETFDRVTGQPDCVDPEKEKLIERVAGLEAKLDEIAKTAASGQEHR